MTDQAKSYRILLLCLGNICRSPMAEAVLRHQLDAAGLSQRVTVDSVGLSGHHVGQPAHRGTLAVLKRHGVPYDGTARQFTPDDAAQHDLVLVMDHDNLKAVQNMLSIDEAGHVDYFLRYAHDEGSVDALEVPDPYYNNQLR